MAEPTTPSADAQRIAELAREWVDAAREYESSVIQRGLPASRYYREDCQKAESAFTAALTALQSRAEAAEARLAGMVEECAKVMDERAEKHSVQETLCDGADYHEGAEINRRYREEAEAGAAAIRALSPQPTDMGGWRLVPMEPTRAMTGAGEDADGSTEPRCGCEDCDAVMHEHYAIIYRAMLSAAPLPAQTKE